MYTARQFGLIDANGICILWEAVGWQRVRVCVWNLTSFAISFSLFKCFHLMLSRVFSRCVCF
jgi:hypothetical protein